MSRQVFPPAHTRVLPARLPMCVPLGVSDLSAFARARSFHRVHAYRLVVYALVCHCRRRTLCVWALLIVAFAVRRPALCRDRSPTARLRPTEGTRAGIDEPHRVYRRRSERLALRGIDRPLPSVYEFPRNHPRERCSRADKLQTGLLSNRRVAHFSTPINADKLLTAVFSPVVPVFR